MPVDVVLHAAAHLVDGGQPELGDMERVEHANRSGKLLVQRGGVSAERVQRCGRDLRPPLVVALMQPGGEHHAGPAGDHVEQPRGPTRCQIGDTGRVHGRVLSGGAQEHSLAHPDRARRVQPCRVVDDRLATSGDDPHDRRPADTERGRDPRHGAVAGADLLERPRPGTLGQTRAGFDRRMLLGPGLLGTPRMWATQDSFAPAHHDADRQVAHPHRTATLCPRHRAAVGARHHPGDGLDQQLQLTAGIRGGQHAKPVQPEQCSNNPTGNLCLHLELLGNPCDLGCDHGSCEPQAHDQLISQPKACHPVSPLPGS